MSLYSLFFGRNQRLRFDWVLWKWIVSRYVGRAQGITRAWSLVLFTSTSISPQISKELIDNTSGLEAF
jgi:low affinity Fe/Cu permease